MITKHIVVEPFDEHWRLDFLKIQNELTDALGQLAISIEHVGSTSVQGLSAKPIIDIDVVIKDYNALKDTISALEKIGYQYEGDLGIPGREAFRYDGKDHLKKHHLYVCPADSPELKRHIAFRNYLRTHPDAVRKYSLIKEEGAKKYPDDIERYIESQVFIREFKGQLHRYLNIHRIIWEKIDNIKDKVNVKGSEIVKFTTKLEGYSKTVNLIDGRINQMSTYISTREKIVKADPELTEFLAISGYRYETLRDTLNYIQYLWDMTQTHLNQAKSLFFEIKSDVTNSSVSNLTVVTSMSAGASLLGLLNESLPTINLMGFVYFLILALIGWISTKILSFIGKQRKYEVTDVEYDKDIK